MHAPEKIEPRSLADYLGALARAVFEPGLNWRVVEAKWSGILEAFEGFDPVRVAGFTPADVERLVNDPRIIRNRAKVDALVHNAGEMLRIDREYGSFRAYLRSHDDYAETVSDLRRRFKFIGESGAYHFLYVVGEPVPSHEAWMATHA